MAPAATSMAVTTAGDFIFRACYTDPFQGQVGGIFAAKNQNCKKAAVLYDNDNDYSVGLKDNFVQAFQKNGGTVVDEEAYSTGDVDFNAQITKVKAKNPDVIYLPDYYGTVALVASQLRAQGITVPFVGADGWDGLQDHGKVADFDGTGYYSAHYAPDSTDPKVQDFVKNYEAKNKGSVPTAFGALGYDSVYLIRDAILKAGTSTDTTKIRDALAATNGDYLTGHLTFDANRNPVKSAVMLALTKGNNGKLKAVYKATINP
jgi:branched-chain amino acid transport system substrate-binding protein